MENSDNDITSRVWFNSRLFSVSGQPLQFYIDGYEQWEFDDIIRIIEAYGGKLSAPTGETIVFSEPGRQVQHPGTIYHIKCLHDSIASGTFQDINKYLLSSVAVHEMPIATKNQMMEQTGDENKSNLSNIVTVKCEEDFDSQTQWELKEPSIKIQDFLENTKNDKFFSPNNALSKYNKSCRNQLKLRQQKLLKNKKSLRQNIPKCANRENSIENSIENSPHIIDSDENIFSAARTRVFSCSNKISVNSNIQADSSSTPRSLLDSNRSLQTPEVSSHIIMRTRLQSPKQYHENLSNANLELLKVSDTLPYPSNSPKKDFNDQEDDSGISESSTKVLNFPQQISNSIPSSSRAKTSNDGKTFNTLGVTTPNDLSLMRHQEVEVDEHLKEDSRKRTTARPHFYAEYFFTSSDESDNNVERKNCRVDRRLKPHNSQRKTPVERKVKRSRHPYSEEENQKIVDYLVRNNAISSAAGQTVWKEFEAQRILVNPYRSNVSLWKHFKRSLQNNYQKYVNDPQVLQEFKKIQDVKKKRVKYTEEDNRLIINYLIDSSAISKATGYSIWQKIKTVIPHLNGTWMSIRNHYLYFLRYNFTKYTINPEALVEFSANVGKKIHRQKNSSMPGYTQSEKKTIIQHLIDNNSISHGFSKRVWVELQEKKVFHNPVRSWRGLYLYFRRRLLPNIELYVDNPALLAEFELLRKSTKTNR